jgi:hypothetical protein
MDEYRRTLPVLHAERSSRDANNGSLSAEEELIARFGSDWDGAKTVAQKTPNPVDVAIQMREAALDAQQKRKANIEALLGPIGNAPKPNGRIVYVVRLGESLKSIALRHPALKCPGLWKVLAEINGLSTKVDAKGTPCAVLSRGMQLLIPTSEEITAYLAKDNVSAIAVTISQSFAEQIQGP